MVAGEVLAVVTGATGGIGRVIARALSAQGYGVVAQYASNEAGAEALRAELIDGGGVCWPLRADLTKSSGFEHLVQGVVQILDARPEARLGVLVNNAAKLVGPGFFEATGDQFDEYMALNLRAPFFLTQRLSEHMAPGGSIVNISSAGAHFASPGDIVYAMSKAAVESLTVHAAPALAERGLRINAVIPGFTDNGHEAFDIPMVRQYMSSFAVLGGISDPSTVAEAVVFLASDRAARTTAATLDVSGGSTLGARPSAGVRLKDILTNRET